MSRALSPTELPRHHRGPAVFATRREASPGRESNSGPSPYHGDALPTELPGQRKNSLPDSKARDKLRAGGCFWRGIMRIWWALFPSIVRGWIPPGEPNFPVGMRPPRPERTKTAKIDPMKKEPSGAMPPEADPALDANQTPEADHPELLPEVQSGQLPEDVTADGPARGDTAEDATTPTPQKPATPSLVMLLVFSVVAMAASAELVLAELTSLKEPSAQLGCDLNPLIGCSASLSTWQAHLLFGIPNALVGLGLFAGLAGVFLAWFGGRLPRWLPLLIEAGLTAALVLIVFFLHQSIFEFTKLCPYCFVVWVCTIVLWVQLGAVLMRLGWLFPGSAFARFWTAQRWLITAIILLLIVLIVAVTLSDKLVYLF